MISAHQHAVAEVLGDNFVHEIPPYQRPYSWTKDEALQLLDDLDQAVATSTTEPYFLGSIVLIRPPEQILGQVVDGQQRLTTLTILAAVLRDLATNDQERDALGRAVYIEPNPFLDQVEAIRIKAHPEDATFFRDAIQVPGATAKAEPPQPPKSEAQELMWENAAALRATAGGWAVEQRQRLVTFLLNRCVIVVVATESRTSALRIFRVLNDRGLDLSNADVIKADLLEKFGEGPELTHQAARWREFENDLDRDNFEALLEHLRFVREGGKNRKTLSEAYADRFAKADVIAVRQFLDDELAPAKKWFAEIVDGEGAGFPEALRTEASEALTGLRLVPNRDWMPAALAAAMMHGTAQRTVDLLSKLEGLAWTLQLGRRYDTQRMNRYAEVIAALSKDESSLAAALRPTPTELADAWQALNGPLYVAFPVRVVRALLERLDRLLAEQPVQWSGQITVEHILPQTPAQGQWEDFTPEEREAATHSLGNLVLLTKRKNSSASNYPFKQKRDVYFGLGADDAQKRATYASVQELAHIDSWCPEALSKRHARHIAVLAKRWGLEPPPTA